MVQSNIANLLSNGLPLHWPFPLSASSSFTSVWSLLPCKFPDIRKQKQRHRTAAPHVTRREQLYFYVSARIFRKLNHSLLNRRHRRRHRHRHHNHDNAYDGAYDVYDIYDACDAYEVYGDTGHDAHSTNYNNYANSHCDDESGHKNDDNAQSRDADLFQPRHGPIHNGGNACNSYTHRASSCLNSWIFPMQCLHSPNRARKAGNNYPAGGSIRHTLHISVSDNPIIPHRHIGLLCR